MWRMFNERQDEIRNSDMKGTKPTFMHSQLRKKQIIILSIQETSQNSRGQKIKFIKFYTLDAKILGAI